MKKKLAIVLPCYNPPVGWEKNVLISFEKIQELLSEVEISLIIVNDGSGSDFKEEISILEENVSNFTFIHNKVNKGKGDALRCGVKNSDIDLTIFTDIDFPYHEQGVIDIYNQLISASQFDVVIGTRDASYYETVPRKRIYISKIFKFFTVKLLALPVTDTQCGLKGFNKKGKELFLKTTINRYLFDVEFIYLAAQTKNINIKSQPVFLKENVIFSKMNTRVLISESINFLTLFWKHYFTPNKKS